MGMAKTHKGEWVPFCTPDDPLPELKVKIRELRGTQTHPEFAELHFQESDQAPKTILRFHPPVAPAETVTRRRK